MFSVNTHYRESSGNKHFVRPCSYGGTFPGSMSCSAENKWQERFLSRFHLLQVHAVRLASFHWLVGQVSLHILHYMCRRLSLKRWNAASCFSAQSCWCRAGFSGLAQPLLCKYCCRTVGSDKLRSFRPQSFRPQQMTVCPQSIVVSPPAKVG